MNPRLIALALVGSPLGAAIAPDTMSDKIYFERSDIGNAVTERTIVFRPDGRFVYLRLAVGRILNGLVLSSPPSDGMYTFSRTSEVDGTVRLESMDGTVSTLFLGGFSTPNTGFYSSGPARGVTFVLVDGAVVRARPAHNMSVRGRVAAGRPLIVGLVVQGAPPANFQEVMVRVIGPSLATLGVSDVWSDPDFEIFQASGTSAFKLTPPGQQHSDDWDAKIDNAVPGPALEKIFAYTGAFRLLAGSKDSVEIVRLRSGAYTIVCSPKLGDAGGEALVEVYFLP
jgi:hypothetical protein